MRGDGCFPAQKMLCGDLVCIRLGLYESSESLLFSFWTIGPTLAVFGVHSSGCRFLSKQAVLKEFYLVKSIIGYFGSANRTSSSVSLSILMS